MRFLTAQEAPPPLVDVGKIKMPARFEAHLVDHDDGAPNLTFVFEVRNGVPECRHLHIDAPEDGHEIRWTGLAGIRVQDVLEEAIKRLISDAPTVADGRVNWPKLYPSDHQQRGAVRDARTARAARKITITDELLREVAEVYRSNIAAGRPTAEVANYFDKAHRTAALYVKTARDRTDPETGKPFLGPTTRGKAGEQS